MQHERVLVLDFGGQYNQLIARRVREQSVYCDLKPCDMTVKEIKEYAPKGIIFTGGEAERASSGCTAGNPACI